MIRPCSLSRVAAVVALLVVLQARVLAAQCPTGVVFEPTGPGSTDAGWNGIEHDMIVGGTDLALGIDCPTSTPPCGTCTITGIASTEPLRCDEDPSRPCTIATEVVDCGAPDSCRRFLGPPQSLGLGGLQLCVLQRLAGDVTGTVDVESGAFAPTLSLDIRLHTGPSYTQGCPRCFGDPVPNDGVAGGTCELGIRAGLACDAHATSTLSDFGDTSFDCPPEITPSTWDFHAGTFAPTTGSLTRTLSATSPRCNGLVEPTRCFCGTCNNADAQPCASNADCPFSGGTFGICGSRRCIGGTNAGAPCNASSICPGGGCSAPGEPTKPNACLDDTLTGVSCVEIADGDGECPAGPVVTYCSNHLNRGCTSDADCDGVPGACAARLRSCFADNGVVGATVSVSGTATPPVAGVADPTDLAVLTCMRPTNDAFYDAAGGFPGLLRHVQPGRLTFGEAPGPTATPIPTPTVTPIPDPCSASPAICREPIQSAKSSLQLVDRSPDDKDAVAWKWMKGAATSVADLGDPTASDAYALCLYDDAGLRATLTIQAGGLCAGKPCWRRKSSGFLYANNTASPDGITQLVLKAGADGKAQLRAKGRGALLPLPPLASLNGTLTAQLRNRASGLCWGATFTPPFDKRTDEQLKDKSD